MRSLNANVFELLPLLAGILVYPADAEVTAFTSSSEWQSAAGPFTTITFTEFPAPTILTDQYVPVGLTFTGSAATSVGGLFLLDGVGLINSEPSGAVPMSFSQPISVIGVDYVGEIGLKLFSQGSLVFSQEFFGGFPTKFAGLISTRPFDAAIVYDPELEFGVGHIYVDTLYFGPPVPAPAPGAALPLLALGLLSRSRRCR